MEKEKIRYKDLSGWLKFGIVGGILYIFIIAIGFIVGLTMGLFSPI